MKFGARISVLLVLLLLGIGKISAFSLALDSIATWGKFPKFCVDVYYWGDRFFNTYDSTYVVGTGKKFNVKIHADSWIDYYSFEMKNRTQIRMYSNPSTSLGASLTYLAVSAGYDVNLSKIFNGEQDARKKFNFSFCCALFAADFDYAHNDISTRISRFGPSGDNKIRPRLPFDGINCTTFNLDAYYFFNHKKYSQAAAFNYSKIQKRSQGSPFIGFSLSLQNVDFNFSELNNDLKRYLPEGWSDRYYLKSNNYTIKIGYGYNWVFAPKWLLGVSVAPSFGFRYGFENDRSMTKYGFSMLGTAKLSIIYNRKNWFAGMISRGNLNLYANKMHTFVNSIVNVDFSVGYRFNLW